MTTAQSNLNRVNAIGIRLRGLLAGITADPDNRAFRSAAKALDAERYGTYQALVDAASTSDQVESAIAFGHRYGIDELRACVALMNTDDPDDYHEGEIDAHRQALAILDAEADPCAHPNPYAWHDRDGNLCIACTVCRAVITGGVDLAEAEA